MATKPGAMFLVKGLERRRLMLKEPSIVHLIQCQKKNNVLPLKGGVFFHLFTVIYSNNIYREPNLYQTTCLSSDIHHTVPTINDNISKIAAI